MTNKHVWMSFNDDARLEKYCRRLEQVLKDHPDKVAVSNMIMFDWVCAFCMLKTDRQAEKAIKDFIKRVDMLSRARKPLNIFEAEPQ